MSDKDLLAKIRKILAKTEEAGCTQAESQAAFALASKLMTEHNLSMDDVHLTENEWIQEEVDSFGRFTLDDNLCFGILKKFYFIEAVANRNMKPAKLFFFGKPENVEVARFLWFALHEAFDKHWRAYRITHKKSAQERRLFVLGMAQGFTQRMQEERKAQEIERDLTTGQQGSTALVLSTINQQLRKAFDEHNGKLMKQKANFSPFKGDSSTLEDGIKTGKAMNINRILPGGGKKAIEDQS